MPTLKSLAASALALAVVAALPDCRADFVINGSFQSGGTPPFALAAQPGATAGPTDGGILFAEPFDVTGRGVENAATFSVGTTGGTSAAPIGAILSQVIAVPATDRLALSADFAVTSSRADSDPVTAFLYLDGIAIASYAFAPVGANQVLRASLSATFTVPGLAGGTASETIGVGFGRRGPMDPYSTEYATNIQVVEPGIVPEPASVGMLLLGVGMACLGARRLSAGS